MAYGKDEFKKCANALNWIYDDAKNTIDIDGEIVLLFVETISIERPTQPQRRMPFGADFLSAQVSTTKCFSLGICPGMDFFLSIEYVVSPANGSPNYRIDFVELINNATQFFSANPSVYYKRFDGTSTKATNGKVGGISCIKYKNSDGSVNASILGAYLTYFDNRPFRQLIINQPNLNIGSLLNLNKNNPSSSHPSLLTALRTKPFLLLAGISGTGKSRIVRELARACWQPTDDEYKAHKPRNFEMVQVKPNWHDSSELIGYVSRIGEKPEFIAGEFLKFVAKAWSEPFVPYFLCLDEMNLAPVEQYFAEYLSVIESRKLENGKIVTDPLLKKEVQEWYLTLVSTLTNDENLHEQFLNEGISIPQNLFVVGTVNMDETTFSFSRKVLDRAMTIEMNEVDLNGGLEENAASEFGYIGPKDNGEPSVLIPQVVEGKDVYSANKELCGKVIGFLTSVNQVLDKTPFKIAYRTRNEFLVYAVCRGEEYLNNALDEMTSMKILSRIEGDADKTERVLNDLDDLLKKTFEDMEKSVSLAKIDEMKEKLKRTQYTSFWS